MKKIALQLSIILLSLSACSDMIEAERQENLQRCQRACNRVFSDFPEHYNMCMNSGMDSYGYYNGNSCESYIKPHLRCMGSGLVPNRNAVNEENEYSRCVLQTQEREEDRDLTREINRPSTGPREVCTKNPYTDTTTCKEVYQ